MSVKLGLTYRARDGEENGVQVQWAAMIQRPVRSDICLRVGFLLKNSRFIGQEDDGSW